MATYWKHFGKINPTKKYHPETALSLAIACDLAYKSKKKVEDTAKGWGYSKVEFINIEKGIDIDTQCYVMADKKNIIVVFRGSGPIEDWLANFQAVRDPGPLKSTLAHEGFQDALYPAVIKLTEVIERYRTKQHKIWVSGHSLGGALCSLYAGMLIENGYPVHGIYTFASPRPGNSKFAKRLDKAVKGPHHRVANTGDIVPHLPPEPFFSHPGKRMILTDKERESTKDSWLAQRIEALKVFVAKTGKLLNVASNHRLGASKISYIPRLIKDLERENAN